MTCCRVIFWEPGCCGVYSVYSTIWMVQGLNCGRDKIFIFSKMSELALGPTQLSINGYRVFPPY